MKDIFERSRLGEPVSIGDADYEVMREALELARRVTGEINTVYHTPVEVLGLLRRLGAKIDDSAEIRTPFYTDFGKFIEVGKNVFVNNACTFMDRGGMITENHDLDPAKRRTLISNRIVVKRNVWIGAAATILPGMTIGENAVVAAGAVVSRDVPPKTIVAGVPAKVIKQIQ